MDIHDPLALLRVFRCRDLSDRLELAVRDAGSALGAFFRIDTSDFLLLPNDCFGGTISEAHTAHLALLFNDHEVYKTRAHQRGAMLIAYVSVVFVAKVVNG